MGGKSEDAYNEQMEGKMDLVRDAQTKFSQRANIKEQQLNYLVKNRFVDKNKNGLYTISNSNNVKEIDKYRLENVNKISEMSCKLFNAARIYKN